MKRNVRLLSLGIFVLETTVYINRILYVYRILAFPSQTLYIYVYVYTIYHIYMVDR